MPYFYLHCQDDQPSLWYWDNGELHPVKKAISIALMRQIIAYETHEGLHPGFINYYHQLYHLLSSDDAQLWLLGMWLAAQRDRDPAF
jgi:hypothetical protein